MSDSFENLPVSRQIGDRGEALAATYLEAQGFRILHRNWRHGHYELDLVALRDGILHVVEVKTRKECGLTTPEEAITASKLRALQCGVRAYLVCFQLDIEVEFDLIAIEHRGEHALLRYIPRITAY